MKEKVSLRGVCVHAIAWKDASFSSVSIVLSDVNEDVRLGINRVLISKKTDYVLFSSPLPSFSQICPLFWKKFKKKKRPNWR